MLCIALNTSWARSGGRLLGVGLSGLALSLGTGLGAPAADGLYATFHVTRNGEAVGEFTASLDFERAPLTVANFAGLAGGAHAWIDFQRGGSVRRPFYEGITFHRVAPGFVIQAGSPNGRGTDGPGYTFRDEFHPELRHSRAGVLSMANSGPHSNGSQFFVTLDAASHLDDLHSVFGEVVEGLDVVHAVQQEDVIQAVIITRNGEGAAAFDTAGQGLPVIVDARPRLRKTLTGFDLDYPLADNAEFLPFHSKELAGWEPLPGRFLYGKAPARAPHSVSALAEGHPFGFFAVAKVQYSDPIHTPPSITGKRVTFRDQEGFTLAFSFAEASAGSYTFELGGSSDAYVMNFYEWVQEAYRGRMFADILNTGGLGFNDFLATEARLNLLFSSPNAGTYRGVLYNQILQTFTAVGTFEVSDL